MSSFAPAQRAPRSVAGAATKSGKRAGGRRPSPASRQARPTRARAPSEALGLLMALRPGACQPGEAVAPAAISDAHQASCARRGTPAAMPVRNTFLDEPPRRSESLERFIEPRISRSTPPSAFGSGRLEVATALDDGDMSDTLPPFMIHTPTESVRDELLVAPRGEMMTWPRTPEHEPGSPRAEAMSWPRPASPTMLGKRGPVLNLSEALRDAQRRLDPLAASTSSMGSRASAGTQDTRQELGSQALPSRGSALHRYGACKPCAFVFREGCRGGVDCQFCHLCDAGERKARKKEQMAAKRLQRQEGRQLRQAAVGGC